MDVGSPFYGQLLKVKGKENENVNVTATQHTPAPVSAIPNTAHMCEQYIQIQYEL